MPRLAPKPGASRRARSAPADVTIKVDGSEYPVWLSELSALDSAALRAETGFSVRAVLAAASDDPDLDVVAAIVWLSRRQAGDPVSFAEVAAGIGYDAEFDTVTSVEESPTLDDDADEVAPGPLS